MSDIKKSSAGKIKSMARHVLKYRMFYRLPDRLYLKIMYHLVMGKHLHLQNPVSFNEKLQWLKLHDRNPRYTVISDKFAVRKYVADSIGEQYLIPLIGVWDQFDQIDFNTLPDQFVLKCTHDSGGVLVCHDKKGLDIDAAAKRFNRRMKNNYYYLHREWPYKNIKPRIVCEKLIAGQNGIAPVDYKIHCFNGYPDNVMVCTSRQSGHTKYFYFNRQWELLKYNQNGISPAREDLLPKPVKLDEMFEIAKVLSRGIPYVRVDLYYENDAIYFGEMTLYSEAGFDYHMLEKTDLLFGEKLDLQGIHQHDH